MGSWTTSFSLGDSLRDFVFNLTPYGGGAQNFIDNSGNAHMFGCALVMSADGTRTLGSGIVECNHFQDTATYKSNARALLPPGFQTPTYKASKSRILWVLAAIALVASLVSSLGAWGVLKSA